MKKIIILIMLITPVFASAQDGKAAAVGTKPRNAQAEAKKKTNVYKTIADELLKNIEGADKKIAVAGFSYSDGRDSRDGGVVAERITTELVKIKKFKIIERKEIEKVFEELKLQRSGAIDSDSVKEIGKMLGADWMVVGTLTELPDKQIELNARMVGVESGEIINAANTQVKKDWLDQYKKLLAEETKAIEKNSKDAKAFYERGRTNLDLKKYDEAIADFSLAITFNPNYAEAYKMRGKTRVFLFSKIEFEKAIEDYTKAIEINPKDAEAYKQRAKYSILFQIDSEQIRHEKAVEDYTKAIEINPKDTKAYKYRARVYEDMGESDKAIEDFSKAIAIDPKNDPKSALAYHIRGVAYESKGNYDKALNDLNMTIKLNPKFQPRIQPLIDWIKSLGY